MPRARAKERACPHCQAPPSSEALREALLGLWPTLPLQTQMVLVRIAQRARPLPAEAMHGKPRAYTLAVWHAKHG